MKELSEKIKKLRKYKGYSQKELAELIGISQPTLFNIEHGATDNISIKVGISLSKALDVPFLELFGIESNVMEVIKLKRKAVIAVDQFVSNSVFFKSMELDANNQEQNQKFDKYREQMDVFKKGVYQFFVSTGFCDQAELRAIITDYHSNKPLSD